MAKVKIPYENETVDADEMEFRVLSGAPVVIKISDGTEIEFEHGISRVYRLCDKKKEDGSPIYVMTGGSKVTMKTQKPETVDA